MYNKYIFQHWKPYLDKICCVFHYTFGWWGWKGGEGWHVFSYVFNSHGVGFVLRPPWWGTIMMRVVKPRWRIRVRTLNFSCELSRWVLGLKLKTSGAFFGAKTTISFWSNIKLSWGNTKCYFELSFEATWCVASHFGAFCFRTIQVLFWGQLSVVLGHHWMLFLVNLDALKSY